MALHIVSVASEQIAKLVCVKCAFGEIQIADRADGVMFDLQSVNLDVCGYPMRQHAYGLLQDRELVSLHAALGRLLSARQSIREAA